MFGSFRTLYRVWVGVLHFPFLLIRVNLRRRVVFIFDVYGTLINWESGMIAGLKG